MKAFTAQIILFSSALLARLFFLFEGYGVEEDSWGHVLNAAEMTESGTYVISRLPGHPLYEGLLLIFYKIHTPFLYNFGSALAGSIAVMVFYRIARKTNEESAFMLSLAFSFVPIFFISSTYTIDYAYSLLFLLLSMQSILNQKTIESALWLAIATGFRITSLGFLAPLFLLIWHQQTIAGKALKLREMTKLGSIAVLLSMLFYMQAFQTYGILFFDFHKPPYPPLLEVFYKASIGVWGFLAFPFVALAVVYFFLKNKNVWRHSLVATAIVFGISYARMPEKAAFWLPVVPMVLFFIGKNSSTRMTKGLALIMIASAFSFGINKTDPYTGSSFSTYAIKFGSSDGQLFIDPFNGPIQNDSTKRKNKERFVDLIQKKLIKIDEPTLLVAGYWQAMLEVNRNDDAWQNPMVRTVYLEKPEALEEWIRAGYELRYLPQQAEINDRKHNTTFTVTHGKILEIE